MKDGRNLGDELLVRTWLRQVHQAKEVLCFKYPLLDGFILDTVCVDPDEIQLYKCVEHIAHILQIPILYKFRDSKTVRIEIQFDGVTYFELYDIREEKTDGK